MFGDDDPTGQVTTRGMIAGVVRDVRQEHLDRPSVPELYYPVAQNWSQLSDLGMTLVVAARERPEALTEPVRAIVRAVNPELAIFNVRTMDRVVDDSLSDFALYLSLIAGFAVLALVLALTGTYGVIAYLVSARTKEFAIRAALGADAGRVTRLVLARGVVLTGIGLAIGFAAALLASPLVNGLPVNVAAARCGDRGSGRGVHRAGGDCGVPRTGPARRACQPNGCPQGRIETCSEIYNLQLKIVNFRVPRRPRRAPRAVDGSYEGSFASLQKLPLMRTRIRQRS